MRSEETKGPTKKGSGFIPRVLVAALAAALTLAAPMALASNAGHDEHTAAAPNSVDRAAVENLQRWVSSGHESWCKDPRLVAANELRRAVPELSGEEVELQPLELDEELITGTQAIFTWTNFDGSASYRVTVARFAWLLPIAGRLDEVIWVPTNTERVTAP